MIFADIETTPVTHEEPLPKFVVMGYAVDDYPVQFVFDKRDAQRIVGDAREEGEPMIWHNGAFDLAVLDIYDPGPWYDTQIRAVIQGAADGEPDVAGHPLKQLAKNAGYTMAKSKDLQLSFRDGVVPSPEQLAYLREDVLATRVVFKSQGGRVIPDETRQTNWSRDVFELGRRGLRVDAARLQAGLDTLRGQYEAKQGQLIADGVVQPRGPKKDPWRKVSVDSKSVQHRLHAAGVTKRTEGSKAKVPQLSRDAETLRATADPVLHTLADYYNLEKAIGLWEGYNTPGSLIRARYKPLMVTGRMSCSDPNVQQIPKKGGLRECIIPSPGNVLVQADFKALELYTLTDTMNCWNIHSRMGSMLDAGEDVHTYVARAAGVTRAAAKVMNFGMAGGMGPGRLQEAIRQGTGQEWTLDEAYAAKKAWERAWPEVVTYWAHIKQGYDQGEDKFFVVAPRSGRGRLGFYSQVMNFPFQSTGSDVAKRALELILRAKLPVVAMLHDEFLLDSPAAEAEEHGRVLARLMQQAGEEICGHRRWPLSDVSLHAERWASKG